MSYGLIAIYDTDSDYANSLANYFRLKGCLSSEIVVFTRSDSFHEFTNSHSLDILLTTQELIETVNIASLTRNVFILCHSRTFTYDGIGHCLFKYSSAEDLLRDTMASYEPDSTHLSISFTGVRKSQITGVYSPVCRCGKTSFSLSLAIQHSLKSSCLLLSMDETSPIKYLLPADSSSKNLDDLLYYFLQSPQTFESKLLSIVKPIYGVDIIPPSNSLSIFSQLSLSEWARFLQSLADIGKYEHIIIDFGTVSPVHSLFALCTHLYMPQPENDTYAADKITLFKEYLQSTDPDCNVQIQSITLPYVAYHRQESEYLKELSSGHMARLVASIINQS